MSPVPQSKWRWFGCAGHFIAASSCLFHLHTRVGNYRISTIGNYRPEKGGPAKAVGAGRLYETFVFRVEGEDEDGEGRIVQWSEIDAEAANDEPTATANHMVMCRKYAKRGPQPPVEDRAP